MSAPIAATKSSGEVRRVRCDDNGSLLVAATTAIPAAADILDGTQTFTATTAATTVITVPAGRTWIGEIAVSVAVGVAAASSTAGEARGTVSTAGTGVTPAAGTLFEVECLAGANAATGTVGTSDANTGKVRAVVIAPVGNAVTVAFATTQTGTASRASCSAIGELQ